METRDAWQTARPGFVPAGILSALGLMSVTWMAVVAALVAVQKLLHPRAPVDLGLPPHCPDR
jgi:hypothetical protein